MDVIRSYYSLIQIGDQRKNDRNDDRRINLLWRRLGAWLWADVGSYAVEKNMNRCTRAELISAKSEMNTRICSRNANGTKRLLCALDFDA